MRVHVCRGDSHAGGLPGAADRGSRHPIQGAQWSSEPAAPSRDYTDLYGNPCVRAVLPTGKSTFAYQAVAVVPDATEEADEGAPERAPGDLPDDVLIYTLPSRYCSPDVLGDEAWRRFGGMAPGYRRVQAICDYVHGHLTFQYGSTTALSSAVDVNLAGRGVCRDFAHLAISFCRALNIPAVRLWLPSGHGRSSGPGADGLRGLDRGLAGRPVVDLRSPQQHQTQRPGRHRPRSRRVRCSDGHDVRRSASRIHARPGRRGPTANARSLGLQRAGSTRPKTVRHCRGGGGCERWNGLPRTTRSTALSRTGPCFTSPGDVKHAPVLEDYGLRPRRPCLHGPRHDLTAPRAHQQKIRRRPDFTVAYQRRSEHRLAPASRAREDPGRLAGLASIRDERDMRRRTGRPKGSSKGPVTRPSPRRSRHAHTPKRP